MNNKLKDDEIDEEDAVEDDDEEDDEDEELEEIEEIDEETRNILFKAINNNKTFDFGDIDDNKNIKNIKDKKTKPNKENKTLSLEAFTRSVNSNKTKGSTKKFVSKRADDKKKELGMDENVGPKRQFNARLPPYNYVHNNVFNIRDIKLDSNKEFPSLKT